ncbi:GPI-anchored cell wall organization protein Ecm33 [Aspergillus taichungensis]|uniref:GPI-anchored cell wall organization protein Ecm33 n=1 Tax=Aspergillus taichungensis TaxID=482145 RepID=A0A2J5HG46_9EURO|nr:GPI-anchored cell wall organization protein Ecm33 [Aspergillus taichungensis]
MVVLKYALPVLAAAGAVFAADCGSGDTIKIENQSDLEKYSSCKTIKGDLKIEKQASGDLSLNGVEEIDGSFTSDLAANITSLAASELTSIKETFHLDGLTSLSSLRMPALTKVGTIEFTALPMLQRLGFDKGVTDAGDVHIANTGLTSLDGISLKQVGQLDITDNVDMKKVDVENLKNATGLMNFAGNSKSLEISLPNLAGAKNMTFRDVSTASFPSLEKLSGQLGFWGVKFETFSAPNLTETGDLVFKGNEKLSNISMPNLKNIHGGFQITRNDELKSLEFPKLKQVSGAIDFSGKFDEVSLSDLENVRGGFNMQSTGNFSCGEFKKLRSDKVIRGSYKCEGNKDDPTSADGKSGATGTSGGKKSESSEGASVMNVANVPAMGMAAVFGALLQYAL